jgi:hypothetical protein
MNDAVAVALVLVAFGALAAMAWLCEAVKP